MGINKRLGTSEMLYSINKYKEWKFRKYLLTVFLLFFVLCYGMFHIYVETTPPREYETVSLSKLKIEEMNAEDFINMMKMYRIVYILPDKPFSEEGMGRYLKNWPKKSDIPYLLSVINDQELCGVLGDVWSSQSIPRYKARNTVGSMALHLLKGVKEEAFYHYPLNSPISEEERHSIINWANGIVKQENVDK